MDHFAASRASHFDGAAAFRADSVKRARGEKKEQEKGGLSSIPTD